MQNQDKLPSRWKMLNPNIIYEAQITLNQLDFEQRIYIGTAETDFRHRFSHQTKSFNLADYENDTERSKEYWTTKRNDFTPNVTWIIMRKCTPFNTTKKIHYLCLNEKPEIGSYKRDNLLKKRSEFSNKSRHKSKD